MKRAALAAARLSVALALALPYAASAQDAAATKPMKPLPKKAAAGPGGESSAKTSPAKSSGAAAAPGMPKPSEELSQLRYFVGSWTCKGQVSATPMGPAHATTSTVRITSDLGGFWLNGRYEEAKTAENPMPMRFVFVWGHDAKDKSFYAWGFDAFGGSAKQATKGWNGDTLVWDGQALMGGTQSGARDTFTKKGDTELVHKGEMEMEGKWATIDEETCTKVGGKK